MLNICQSIKLHFTIQEANDVKFRFIFSFLIMFSFIPEAFLSMRPEFTCSSVILGDGDLKKL